MLPLQKYAKAPTSESGLEADQKIIAAHGCDATTVTTAWIAENTMTPGESVTYSSPGIMVKTAIDDCFEGGRVEVFKIGRAFSPGHDLSQLIHFPAKVPCLQ